MNLETLLHDYRLIIHWPILIERFHVASPPCWRAKIIHFSLLWEIISIFMQNCFIVSALQHGRCENPASAIAMFRVMSPFVINVPTRDLLVPYTKRSFQIMVGTLAL